MHRLPVGSISSRVLATRTTFRMFSVKELAPPPPQELLGKVPPKSSLAKCSEKEILNIHGCGDNRHPLSDCTTDIRLNKHLIVKKLLFYVKRFRALSGRSCDNAGSSRTTTNKLVYLHPDHRDIHSLHPKPKVAPLPFRLWLICYVLLY